TPATRSPSVTDDSHQRTVVATSGDRVCGASGAVIASHRAADGDGVVVDDDGVSPPITGDVGEVGAAGAVVGAVGPVLVQTDAGRQSRVVERVGAPEEAPDGGAHR